MAGNKPPRKTSTPPRSRPSTVADAVRNGEEPPPDVGGRPRNPANDIKALVTLAATEALKAENKADFYQAFMPIATMQLAEMLIDPNSEVRFKAVRLVQEQIHGKPKQTVETNDMSSAPAHAALDNMTMRRVANIRIDRKELASGTERIQSERGEPRSAPRPVQDTQRHRGKRKGGA